MNGFAEQLLTPEVVAAFAEQLLRQSAVDLSEAKVRENEREAEASKAERSRLMELEDGDAAIRHVDGDDAAPAKPQRKKRLANLNEKIPVLAAAAPLLKARVAERRADLAESKLPFTRAVLEAVRDLQAPAADRIRHTLGQLETDICALVAADFAVSNLVGERFPVPDGLKPPFSGRVVARKLIAAIPDRLRPPTLTIDRVEQRARATATAAIIQLKENAK